MKPLRVLISPNAFKGTLSPIQAARIIKSTLSRFLPHSTLHSKPLADGGDGTLDVLLESLGGKVMMSRVQGPMGETVSARWGVCHSGPYPRTAIIEIAKASGLALVKGRKKILESSSFGTGELIKQALQLGCRRILIGVGGTATSEGGAGVLEALGLRYFDNQGRRLSSKPKDLISLARIDWSHFDQRIRDTDIFVLCDVKNPLLGRHGSAATYGPQKGATPEQVVFLETLLGRWSEFSKKQTRNQPGAGAAGAIAFGLSGFAGAKLVAGAPFIMKMTGWMAAARSADVIVTGEGQLDATSFGGKVLGEMVGRRGRARVFALCGASDLRLDKLHSWGLAGVIEMGKKGMKKPAQALREAAQRLASTLAR